jgi:regulator of protease activity HflC (stomatin/prohibitin superfamily)
METFTLIIIILVILFFFSGIRIVRPTHKLLVETLGKYIKTSEQGFHWVIPIIQSGKYINITERMVDVLPQMVITKDKLNAEVDAVVYYQIKDPKASLYNVDDHKSQLTSLARTTLRAVIGKMTLTDANENRDSINEKVETILDKETASYGVEVLRVELQKIEPPSDVQDSMNNVVKAEQEKIAATDFATAKEIQADGIKRAKIKEGEGQRQFSILEAEGKAQAFSLINKSFIGNAQLFKKYDVVERSLKENSKIILGDDTNGILKLFDLSKVTKSIKKK